MLKPTGAWASEYAAAGSLAFGVGGRGNPNIQPIAKHAFLAQASGCNWLVRIGSNQSNQDDSVGHMEVSCDGKDTYYLSVPKDPKHTAVATIMPGKIPLLSVMPTSQATFIWFALLSACDLPKQPRSKVHFPWLTTEAHGLQGETTMDAELRLSTNTPELPELATFLSDGWTFAHTGERTQFGKPYDRGFTQAAYKATDFTALGEITLPKAFQLKLFSPKYDPVGDSAHDLFVLAEWNGTVTNMPKPSVILPLRPILPKKSPTIVKDKRFWKLNPELVEMCYVTTNKWYETNDPMIVAEIPIFKKMSPPLSFPQNVRRRVK